MRALMIAIAALAVLVAADSAYAQHGCSPGSVCRPADYGNPDLFGNYFVDPNCGGVGAQLYIAPIPVPAHVGHTYYTYQPLMPHEMLYRHKRSYHRYYNEGRGLTRTSISWR